MLPALLHNQPNLFFRLHVSKPPSYFLISVFLFHVSCPSFMTQVRCDHLITQLPLGCTGECKWLRDTAESLLKARDPAIFKSLPSTGQSMYFVYCINKYICICIINWLMTKSKNRTRSWSLVCFLFSVLTQPLLH